MRLIQLMTQTAMLSALATAAGAQAQAGGPTGGRAEVRLHESTAGTREYRLFVPSAYAAAAGAGEAAPLVVMLHGCTQDAADVARGTRLDAHAERAGALVVYPEQPATANPKKCWNWYDAAHQGRDAGEPAIITAIVREVMASHRVDPSRVYVAGISAGGAMAAIVAAAYPEVFAAVAAHSGIAVGAARSVMDALGVMAKGPAAVAPVLGTAPPPLLVVQGGADPVVNAANAEALSTQWRSGRRVEGGGRREEGDAGGYHFVRTSWGDAGAPDVEVVTVRELGHAWSGGSTEGTYTDARGPDATALMMKFLVAHRRAPAKQVP
jgi:poly(hydroxyalkanoate) depolymerase family esterase